MMHKNDIIRLLKGRDNKNSEVKMGFLQIAKAQISRIYRILKNYGNR